MQAFIDNEDKIYDIFSDIEYQRLHQAYEFALNKKLVDKVKKTFGIYLTIPNGFDIATENENFMWIRKETNKDSEGFIIYQTDYTSQDAFRPKKIINNRNAFTKENIPGPSDSSYMSTDTLYVKPVFEKKNLNGNYIVETRGLWKVVNDFMGGPFVSFTFVNQKYAEIITVDAYIYAPGEEKRDYVRQMETILNSLEIIEIK